MSILKMQENLPAKFSVFKITAFEWVAIFFCIMVRIPNIGGQWFNIQSLD